MSVREGIRKNDEKRSSETIADEAGHTQSNNKVISEQIASAMWEGSRRCSVLFWLVLQFGWSRAVFDGIDPARLSAALRTDYVAFEAEAGAECVALSWQHRQVLIALNELRREQNATSTGDRTERGSASSANAAQKLEESEQAHRDKEYFDDSPSKAGSHMGFDSASMPAVDHAGIPPTLEHEFPLTYVEGVALPSQSVKSRRQLSQFGPMSSPAPTVTSSPTSCLKFMMQDFYGDGWQGAKYILRDAIADTVVATGTLDSGSQGTDDICASNGCYKLRVTSGAFDSEVSWTFGTLSGSAPYGPQFVAIVDNDIGGPFQSCPTPAPTHTFLPTRSPTLTPPPSMTPVPSNPPTQVPTPSPTSKHFEARTWSELDDALQVDHASVNVTVDILFAHPIMLISGQDVAVFCNATGGVALDGGGETQLFVLNGGARLRLSGLRITNGYCGLSGEVFVGTGGGAFYLTSGSKAHLTACRIDLNEAPSGGAFYAEDGSGAHLSGCSINGNEASGGGGVFHLYGDSVVHLSGCNVSNNKANGDGGAFYFEYESVAQLSGCDVSNNNAGGDGGVFYLYYASVAFLSGCNVSNNNAGADGAVAKLSAVSTVNVLSSVLSKNVAQGYGGVAAAPDTSCSVTVDGCTLSENTAYVGGLFFGRSIVVRDSVIKHNFADYVAGVLLGAGAFENCLIANNTALVAGGIVYIANGATTFLHCAIENNMAEYGSVAYNPTTDENIDLVIGASSFSNNAPPAILSSSPVVIRNTRGVTGADIADVPVLGCSDSDTVNYCLTVHCSDVSSSVDNSTLLGFNCYCYPDGQMTDPLDASCASSASMSDPVAGVMIASEDVWILVNKPETGSVVIQFSNLGDVRMRWELFISSNSEGLVWNLPNRSGSLAAGEPWGMTLQISSERLQARDAAYVTNFTLNATSPEPTPVPESKSIHFILYTVVSASPITAASYVKITNLAQLTAAGTVAFDITSLDATGMVILDATDTAYSAVLLHSASGDAGICKPVLFNPSTNGHSGECALPGDLACNHNASAEDGGTVVCELSERSLAAGKFILEINDGQGLLVGGSRHLFDVVSCPALYYEYEDACYLCPPGTACEKGTTIETMRLLPGYWRSGV